MMRANGGGGGCVENIEESEEYKDLQGIFGTFPERWIKSKIDAYFERMQKHYPK